jgi:hypothetical protein
LNVVAINLLRISDCPSSIRLKSTEGISFPGLYKQLNNASGSVELPPLFSFRKSKLAKKKLKNMTENIGASGFGITKCDVAYQIDQTAKTGRVKVTSCIDLWQNPLERWILLLDRVHCVINVFTDLRLFGFRLKI